MADRRAWALALVVGIVVFVALLVVVRALRAAPDTPPPRGYDERTRQAFLVACRQGAGAGSDAVCSCAYERVLASVPFSHYLELEDAARRQRSAATGPSAGPPGGSSGGSSAGSSARGDAVVPDELERILVDCVSFNRQLATTTITTAPATVAR